MHRAGPGRPPPQRRDRRHSPPDGGPASMLLKPPGPPPPLLPPGARVSLRPIPQRPPLLRGYRIGPLDVITALLIAAAVLAVLWH